MDEQPQLQRVVDAPDRVYGDVLAKLVAGCKRSHWMGFVVPRLRGLCPSSIALVMATERKSAHDIVASPDDLKFHACLTLFDAASAGEALFGRALTTF